MPFTERSPYIRVLPGAATLDIILKNTHFPDGLLDQPIQLRVEWQDGIPVLAFQFQSASYDFSEPLVPADLKNGERGWLQQLRLTVRLLLADNVVSDQVAEQKFSLPEHDAGKIKAVLNDKQMPSGM